MPFEPRRLHHRDRFDAPLCRGQVQPHHAVAVETGKREDLIPAHSRRSHDLDILHAEERRSVESNRATHDQADREAREEAPPASEADASRRLLVHQDFALKRAGLFLAGFALRRHRPSLDAAQGALETKFG